MFVTIEIVRASRTAVVNSQLLLILLLATVAGIILFRLYSVLGRRTGNERPPHERFERLGGMSEPQKPVDQASSISDRSAKADTGHAADAADRGLTEIALADRSFTPEHFLDGARRAYELIVTAFARGDREALRPLLGEDVYAAFNRGIAEREAQKHRVEFTFVGFRETKVTAASLNKGAAEITVSFAAQFISTVFDSAGALVEGDPKLVRDVVDVWGFERKVRASDPNWRLVATSGEAGLQEL